MRKLRHVHKQPVGSKFIRFFKQKMHTSYKGVIYFFVSVATIFCFARQKLNKAFSVQIPQFAAIRQMHELHTEFKKYWSLPVRLGLPSFQSFFFAYNTNSI